MKTIEEIQHLIAEKRLGGKVDDQGLITCNDGTLTFEVCRDVPTTTNCAYTMVRETAKRVFQGADKFLVILYGAYNAFGLVGTEQNGIAVFNETRGNVVCDNIAQETTGWSGASRAQEDEFLKLCSMDFADFAKYVNAQKHVRYKI